MKTLLTNCRIVSPGVDLEGGAILIEDGKILQLFTAGDQLPSADESRDMGGNMVLPGFIDIHCHGKSGMDFCDATMEAMNTLGMDKLKEGVTTFLPTTLTLPEEQLVAALETAAQYVKEGSRGVKVPGVHLEGPFINPKCLGAQNPDFVRKPDSAMLERLHKVFPVKKISYAVEMEGGDTFASDTLAKGITPSCVHSAATFQEFRKAYDHGLRNLSHFCNQMTPLHHRDIGLVGAGFACKDVYIELICDKLHICPDMIRLAFAVKGPEHIQLITDAMRAAGLPDGKSSLGGLPVIVKNGEARLESNGALAGSTLKLNVALKNVAEVTGLPLKDIVCTTAWNQAQALGLEKVGKIEYGYWADLTVLNKDFDVVEVFVNGESRFSA